MTSMNESEYDRIRRLIMERHTCAQIHPDTYSCVQRTAYDPHTFQPPRNTDDEIKISVLTEENQKLKDQYAELLQKANKLVAAYRELKTENETLKQKKAKRDSWSEYYNKNVKIGQDAVQKFTEWLKK
jgi:uncharacterized protein (DUF3084 family)